ncbi:MAG: hypothetical protein Q7V10_07460 [Methanobacteriaceae archaeon]|nr:hypothetical protein [Methanobacteriaceae archaeon]MDO9626884.1 hypothetical protein [Methanobacteriaceae archaeon]
MSYLICDQCGACYDLEDDESVDDFDLTCECGGHFKHVDSIPSKNDKRLIKSVPNKVLLIPVTVVIVLIIFLSFNSTPSLEKMDQIIPNQVGAYQVPSSSEKMRSYTHNLLQPVNYQESKYQMVVDKYYFPPNGSIMMHVSLHCTGDHTEFDSIENSMGNKFTDDKVINGKRVKFVQVDLGVYMALFHGDTYSVTIWASPAYENSVIPVNNLQTELVSFTENFIPEFDKSNVYS